MAWQVQYQQQGFVPPVTAIPGANQSSLPNATTSNVYPTTSSSSSALPSRTLRNPTIDITECKDDYLAFTLKDTDVSMANAIRRVMIAEVPTLAIDEVWILKNSTILHDEFLAHRLGMLPIYLEGKTPMNFNYAHECEKCENGCDDCRVKFVLDVRHDGPQKTKTIYSDDIRTQTEGVQIKGYSSAAEETIIMQHQRAKSQNESHDVPARGIIIAVLGIGEELKIEAYAKKGMGKMHAKWSPVAVAKYTFQPKVVLNEERLEEITEGEKRELVNVCPVKVFQYEERTKKVTLDNEGSNCIFCNECIKAGRSFRKKADDDNVVRVEPMTNRFNFVVETTGSMLAKDVMTTALKILASKVQRLKDEVKQMEGKKLEEEDDNLSALHFKDKGGFIF